MNEEQDSLTSIGVSFNSFQGQIVKTKLEANGIDCFLFNVESFNAMSHLSLAIGGIRIMVLKSEMDRAKTIILENAEEITAS